MSEPLKKILRENKGILVFLALMMVFRSSFADWNHVPTGSMKPTILEGDQIIINKLAYDLHLPFSGLSLAKLGDPQRGDIVIFNSKVSKQRLVKRVIGIPGDSVAMHNNMLTVNGQRLDYSMVETTGMSQDLQQHSQDLREQLFDYSYLVRVANNPSIASSFGTTRVPNGMYLVLGDNRDNSVDSRFIGFVPRNEIIGRSRKVAFSLNYENYHLPRRDRFAKPL